MYGWNQRSSPLLAFVESLQNSKTEAAENKSGPHILMAMMMNADTCAHTNHKQRTTREKKKNEKNDRAV
jgi:hypothetical protein